MGEMTLGGSKRHDGFVCFVRELSTCSVVPERVAWRKHGFNGFLKREEALVYLGAGVRKGKRTFQRGDCG